MRLALLTEMDDGKMPGEDGANGPEMTVGQLKTHVDKRFEAVDKSFDKLKSDLQDHTSVLFESLQDDIRKVADGVAAQTTAIEVFRKKIASDRARYDGRLENHEARIVALERRKRRSRA
jgi:hypothetical protein